MPIDIDTRFETPQPPEGGIFLPNSEHELSAPTERIATASELHNHTTEFIRDHADLLPIDNSATIHIFSAVIFDQRQYFDTKKIPLDEPEWKRRNQQKHNIPAVDTNLKLQQPADGQQSYVWQLVLTNVLGRNVYSVTLPPDDVVTCQRNFFDKQGVLKKTESLDHHQANHIEVLIKYFLASSVVSGVVEERRRKLSAAQDSIEIFTEQRKLLLSPAKFAKLLTKKHQSRDRNKFVEIPLVPNHDTINRLSELEHTEAVQMAVLRARSARYQPSKTKLGEQYIQPGLLPIDEFNFDTFGSANLRAAPEHMVLLAKIAGAYSTFSSLNIKARRGTQEGLRTGEYKQDEPYRDMSPSKVEHKYRLSGEANILSSAERLQKYLALSGLKTAASALFVRHGRELLPDGLYRIEDEVYRHERTGLHIVHNTSQGASEYRTLIPYDQLRYRQAGTEHWAAFGAMITKQLLPSVLRDAKLV